MCGKEQIHAEGSSKKSTLAVAPRNKSVKKQL